MADPEGRSLYPGLRSPTFGDFVLCACVCISFRSGGSFGMVKSKKSRSFVFLGYAKLRCLLVVFAVVREFSGTLCCGFIRIFMDGSVVCMLIDLNLFCIVNYSDIENDLVRSNISFWQILHLILSKHEPGEIICGSVAQIVKSTKLFSALQFCAFTARSNARLLSDFWTFAETSCKIYETSRVLFDRTNIGEINLLKYFL